MILGVAASVCLVWKLVTVSLADPRVFPDSLDYLEPETFLGTGGGYVNGRLPGVPLFFLALARNHRAIVVAQALLSAASWGVLAFVLARRFSSTAVGVAVGLAVLVLSLTTAVALWDALLLSESLSISLLVLLIAVSIKLLEQPSPAVVATAVVLGGVWVFTRDANSVMLGLGALTLGVLALLRRLPRRVLMVAAAWILLSASVLALQSASKRSDVVMYDVLGLRILTDRDATREFADAGMPVTPAVTRMAGHYAIDGFETIPELADLRAWVDEDGRATYLSYLWRHPDRTFLDPFREGSCRAQLARKEACFTILGDGQAQLDTYPARHWRAAFPTAFDDAVGQRLSMAQYLLAVAFCVLAGIFGLWRGRSRFWGWGVWLALASVVFLLAAWNAEPQELARHTVDAFVYVSLAVIITLGALGDEIVRTRRTRDSARVTPP